MKEFRESKIHNLLCQIIELSIADKDTAIILLNNLYQQRALINSLSPVDPNIRKSHSNAIKALNIIRTGLDITEEEIKKDFN